MNEHTVTAFDDDLNFLVAKISEMGGNAESMVARSVTCLLEALCALAVFDHGLRTDVFQCLGLGSK